MKFKRLKRYSALLQHFGIISVQIAITIIGHNNCDVYIDTVVLATTNFNIRARILMD